VVETLDNNFNHLERPTQSGKELKRGARNLDVGSRLSLSREASPEKASDPPQSPLGTEKRHVSANSGGMSSTVPVVVGRKQRHGRRVFYSIQPVDKPVHGCFDDGLGGACGRDSSFRDVDPRRTHGDKDRRSFRGYPQRSPGVARTTRLWLAT
jgi:hypothetical protein